MVKGEKNIYLSSAQCVLRNWELYIIFQYFNAHNKIYLIENMSVRIQFEIREQNCKTQNLLTRLHD